MTAMTKPPPKRSPNAATASTCSTGASLELLNERTRIVEEIGRIKRETQMPDLRAEARREVFDNVHSHNAGPLAARRGAAHLRAHHRRDAQRCSAANGSGKRETSNMLVVMQEGATEAQIQHVIDRLVELDFDVHRSTGVVHTVLGGVGGKEEFDLAMFEVMEGVKEAHRIVSPYKLASRTFRPGGTVVTVRRR